MSDDIAHLDATAQAELVRTGKVSPAELVDAAIRRIERLNPELNAVITPLFDAAREAARGPLPEGPFRGVPSLLKDIGATSRGDRFCAGLGPLKERDYRAPIDTHYTTRFKGAGFVILGKTNTPELGILPTTEPRAFGPTRNPYDPTRSTGGSSGGAACAVATGMVPVAHANDGGGSIRIPASCCGLVGLKPSRGRVSLGPVIGEINGGLVAEHVVARSVRDSAALLDVLAGPMPGDPYAAPTPAGPFADEVGAPAGQLRIAFSWKYINPMGQTVDAHPDCVEAVKQTAALLAELGHQVDEDRPKALEDPQYVPKFLAVWAAGVAADLAVWSHVLGRQIKAEEVETLTWGLAEMGRGVNAPTYMTAWMWLEANARKVAEFFQRYDLFLTPTVSEPPPPLGSFDDKPGDPMGALGPIFRAATFAPFTPPFNVTGQPAISLPLHKNPAGLPIGTQLVASYGREDLLLRVAAQLEGARGPFTHIDSAAK
ncbi:MAG TPA: amidase [Kofleriaceae bacterium]|nr:amidase [Kofleriaceae bacterium]